MFFVPVGLFRIAWSVGRDNVLAPIVLFGSWRDMK